jgi:hypothetical protein
MTVDELRRAIRTQKAERDRLVAELAAARRLLQRAEAARRRRNGR